MSAQPAIRLLRHPAPSDRAPPKLVYNVEPFYVLAKEIAPLFRKHWRERGYEALPYDPNWDQALALDLNKILHILTVRDGDELVGYVMNIVAPHVHSRRVLQASIDNFWLAPRYRKGMAGVRMFRENEDYLRRIGVKRIVAYEVLHALSPRGKRHRLLFKRLGYKGVEIMHAKVLT